MFRRDFLVRLLITFTNACPPSDPTFPQVPLLFWDLHIKSSKTQTLVHVYNRQFLFYEFLLYCHHLATLLQLWRTEGRCTFSFSCTRAINVTILDRPITDGGAPPGSPYDFPSLDTSTWILGARWSEAKDNYPPRPVVVPVDGRTRTGSTKIKVYSEGWTCELNDCPPSHEGSALWIVSGGSLHPCCLGLGDHKHECDKWRFRTKTFTLRYKEIVNWWKVLFVYLDKNEKEILYFRSSV